MKMLFLILLFSVFASLGATSYTESFCDTATGSNLNAGSTAGAALVSDANGNWDATTGIFICSGATDLSGVSVGMWASVYIDGAAVGVFVGRILAVVDATDTITVSLVAKSGTAPTTSATARSIKIGGAWKGPNAAEGFPFNFVQATHTNASGNVPRVNIKSGTTYNITAAMTHANAGPIRFEGYTTTASDGGRATIDGGTAGASYVLLAVTAANTDLAGLIFQNNGATGTAQGLDVSANECTVFSCAVNSVRGFGIVLAGSSVIAVECEAYLANQSNTAGTGGFRVNNVGSVIVRCVSHDNTNSNASGFILSACSSVIDCIADSNGAVGFLHTGVIGGMLKNCDSYGNGGDGFNFSGASATLVTLENCNAVKNGGFGINSSGSAIRNGLIINCGFGAGTQTNSSGSVATTIGGIQEIGRITYASDVTPWNAPTTGDFRIILAAAKGTGRGTFTETQASYTGTIGYPDVGAAQHLESASAGGGGSFPFAQ